MQVKGGARAVQGRHRKERGWTDKGAVRGRQGQARCRPTAGCAGQEAVRSGAGQARYKRGASAVQGKRSAGQTRGSLVGAGQIQVDHRRRYPWVPQERCV